MSENTTPGYTLGLDIGMASVGAALLTKNRILALYVRSFDKAETAKEGKPLNLTRRSARLARRRTRRRAHRLKRLLRLLRRQELLDRPEPEQLSTGTLYPWLLRAEGLDRCLDKIQWAAALYHIVKHRGFQSTRRSEAKADEKAGEMLAGVTSNQQRLHEGGYRTVGEMVTKDAAFERSKRNKGGAYSHTFARSDLVDELHELFKAQRGYGNSHAEELFESEVEELLLARRPALAGEALLKMVGYCTLERSELRAPKASYSAERFVWFTRLNNLRLSEIGATRGLTTDERQILIELPFALDKLTYKQVRQRLNLAITTQFNTLRYGDAEKDPEAATLFEAKAFHALRKAYEAAGIGPLWRRDALDTERLDTLAYALTCYKDDESLRRFLDEQGIENKVVEAVLEVAFDQFVALSLKALRGILPHMQEGQRYDEAVKSAGYSHHSQVHGHAKQMKLLPSLYSGRDETGRMRLNEDLDLPRNPVVLRALNQARKLVNAIVRRYGPPSAVHIELARDLSKPFIERRKIEREQREYQQRKEDARTEFVEHFGVEPNGLDLMKLRLYQEQDGKSAYSLNPIDVTRLTEPGYAEVDHIIPYSRSYDDSQNNKALVLASENRDKANRTPFEYLDGAGDSGHWQRFEAYVLHNKKYRLAKRDRLLRNNFLDEAAAEFRERNLSDTRYVCRVFKAMIENYLAWHVDSDEKNRCVVVSGQLTALLRARWGLIKHREHGDLHHALDAAVIAATSRSLVKRIADHSRHNELATVRGTQGIDPATGEILDLEAIRQGEERFPEPWPHFRAELLGRLSNNPAEKLAGVPGYDTAVLASIQPVRVSRAPMRRNLGAAHQETIRSAGRDGKLLNDSKSGPRTANKTLLGELKLKDLPNIVGSDDPREQPWITELKHRLELFNGDAAKAFAPSQPPLFRPSAPGKDSPVIRSVKLLAVQKSGISIRNGIAKNGSMLRVDIFTKGGKFHAVPIYVADLVREEFPNRAVVAHKPESEWTLMDESFTFLFSLHPNDWLKVTFRDGSCREGYFGGLDRASGTIDLWLHDRDTRVAKDGVLRGIGIKTAVSLEKFDVSFLGELHRARPRRR